jgi:rod shape-determining protein MreC
MLSFIAVLKRYIHILLFLFFEFIALFLIVTFNQNQREIFLHSSNLLSGSILERTVRAKDYLQLKESNEDLLKENARLISDLINTPRPVVFETLDTVQYSFDVIPARVINNSIQSTRNYFTINKGLKDGIEENMGVITVAGVAGVVKQVSENYALVLSLLNIESYISTSLEGDEYFGTTTWNGVSFKNVILNGIPTHVVIRPGDKVVTNGFSTIFPEGIPIGSIEAFDVSKNGVFYDISVKPFTDFTRLGNVYVLKNNFALERESLELND